MLKYQHVKLIFNITEEKKKKHYLVYIPPFNLKVKTKINWKFFTILNKHFPVNNVFYKAFNKNKLKISNSTMPNIKHIIKGHNQKVLKSKPSNKTPTCNCRKLDDCPLNGQCLTSNTVYQAKVEVNELTTMNYIDSTESLFKKRYSNHLISFRLNKYHSSTALSWYIWDIKDKLNIHPKVSWSIVKRSKSYAGIERFYRLCQGLKLGILLLNKKEKTCWNEYML